MTEVSCAPYAGWDNCLHIQHEDLRLIVTLDVGPRILSCQFRDKPNLFCEFPDELGQSSGDDYMLFGGHRLWHAPEDKPRSYCPDFDHVHQVHQRRAATLEVTLRDRRRHCSTGS